MKTIKYKTASFEVPFALRLNDGSTNFDASYAYLNHMKEEAPLQHISRIEVITVDPDYVVTESGVTTHYRIVVAGPLNREKTGIVSDGIFLKAPIYMAIPLISEY